MTRNKPTDAEFSRFWNFVEAKKQRKSHDVFCEQIEEGLRKKRDANSTD